MLGSVLEQAPPDEREHDLRIALQAHLEGLAYTGTAAAEKTIRSSNGCCNRSGTLPGTTVRLSDRMSDGRILVEVLDLNGTVFAVPEELLEAGGS